MSIKVMADVWQLDLPREKKFLLLALADHADDSGNCFPSKARIAWKCGYSMPSVTRILRDLRNDGLLLVKRVAGDTNRYKLTLDGAPRLRPHEADGGGYQNDTPPSEGGVSPVTLGVSPVIRGGVAGDTLNHQEPSVEPSEGERAPEQGSILPDSPPSKARRASRGPLPQGWAPNATHRARAAASFLDVEREAERFRLHAESTGRTMVSWDAAFTTWLIRSVDFQPKNGHAPDRPVKQGGFY